MIEYLPSKPRKPSKHEAMNSSPTTTKKEGRQEGRKEGKKTTKSTLQENA
jgi:hypothetical protein